MNNVDEKDKKILQLEAEILSLKMVNKIQVKNFINMRTRDETLKKLKYLLKTHQDKRNNMYFYEEGQIDTLLWVLNLQNNFNKEQLKKIKEEY